MHLAWRMLLTHYSPCTVWIGSSSMVEFGASVFEIFHGTSSNLAQRAGVELLEGLWNKNC